MRKNKPHVSVFTSADGLPSTPLKKERGWVSAGSEAGRWGVTKPSDECVHSAPGKLPSHPSPHYGLQLTGSHPSSLCVAGSSLSQFKCHIGCCSTVGILDYGQGPDRPCAPHSPLEQACPHSGFPRHLRDLGLQEEMPPLGREAHTRPHRGLEGPWAKAVAPAG